MLRTRRFRHLVLWVTALTGWSCAAQTQAQPPAASAAAGTAEEQAHKVPVINGNAGPCSLDLRVTTSDGKPVYAAAVKVHVNYGFGGFHKLDLEASTNVDGKVSFTGLPARVRRPPLEFHASKDELAGTATYDPAAECQARHEIVADKAKPSKDN
jgi:hypothetical protein